MAVDAVTAAAEVFHMMMTSGVTIEWCRRHVCPYETCGLFLDDDCDPHVHVIGPKVMETAMTAEWMGNAACRLDPARMWDEARVLEAKQLCSVCPVLD